MALRNSLIFLVAAFALIQSIIAVKILEHASDRTPRKSLGGSIKTLLASIRQREEANAKTSTNPNAPLSKLTSAVMNFVNTSYQCGSEEAKTVIPKIIRLVKGVFKIPFVDIFVNETIQTQLVEKLEECAEGHRTSIKQKRRKRLRKNRYRERAKGSTFFTGAIVNADDSDEAEKRTDKKRHRPSKAMTISFRSILDDIIDAGGTKSQKESKETMMKIISLIDDYLREKENKKRYEDNVSFDRYVSKADSNEDLDDTSVSKGFRAGDDHGTDSRDNSEELVFDHNMEIAVRMNAGDTK